MATTNHPKTFVDLYTALLNNVRADSSVTAVANEAKRMINTALHDIHLTSGEKFQWAHRRDVLRTHPEYTTGTVTATKGSTAVTGSGTDWTGSDDFGDAFAAAGDKMRINSTQEVYEISAVGSGTGITLADEWIDDTTSSATYTIFRDEYSLASDFLRPIDLRSFDIDNGIPLIGKRHFSGLYPRNYITGKPRVATIIDLPFGSDATPVRKVRFHKPPDDAYLIPYWYVTSNLGVASGGTGQTEMSSDTDEPIVPLSFRMMIVHHAAAQWYSERMDDLEMANRHQAQYTDMLFRAQLLNEFGEDRPRIKPKVSPLRRQAQNPYFRGRGRGRHATGSTFDELRD